MYVRLGDSKDVFLAAQTVRNDIAKKPEDFRDRKLTDLTTGAGDPRGSEEARRAKSNWRRRTTTGKSSSRCRRAATTRRSAICSPQVTNARIQEFVADDRGDLHRLRSRRAARLDHALRRGRQEGRDAPDRRGRGKKEGGFMSASCRATPIYAFRRKSKRS